MWHIVLLMLSIVFLFVTKTEVLASAYDIISQRNRATDGSLYVRVSKSYVNTYQEGGDSYTLLVMDNKKTRHGFDGQLEVQSTVCPIENNRISQNCKNYGPLAWPDQIKRVEGGKIRISLTKSANNNALYIKAQFRPRGSSLPWSNFIVQNINSTAGLYDLAKYWNIPQRADGISDTYPALFKGMNLTYNPPVPFRTYFGFAPQRTVCGEQVKPMYITKDRVEGYWQPKLAQDPDIKVFRKNLLWFVMNFDNHFKNTYWEDSYLWALNSFNVDDSELESAGYAGNFMDVGRERALGPGQINSPDSALRSWNPQLPPYILAARWVGEGWGIENDHAYQPSQPGEPPCTIAASNPNIHVLWVLDIDPVQIHPSASRPDLSIPALLLSYHEGSHSFADPKAQGPYPQPENYMLREDWYFQENTGLVKINTNSWGYNDYYKLRVSDNNHLCPTDDDCFVNQEIQHPQVSLTRYSLIDPVPGDVNNDATVDTADFTLAVAGYGKKVPPSSAAGFTVQSKGSSTLNLADVNHDGKINTADYVLILKNLGK